MLTSTELGRNIHLSVDNRVVFVSRLNYIVDSCSG